MAIILIESNWIFKNFIIKRMPTADIVSGKLEIIDKLFSWKVFFKKNSYKSAFTYHFHNFSKKLFAIK